MKPLGLAAAEQRQHLPGHGNVPFDVTWIDYLPFDQLALSSEWWDDNAQEVWAALDEVNGATALVTNRSFGGPSRPINSVVGMLLIFPSFDDFGAAWDRLNQNA